MDRQGAESANMHRREAQRWAMDKDSMGNLPPNTKFARSLSDNGEGRGARKEATQGEA